MDLLLELSPLSGWVAMLVWGPWRKEFAKLSESGVKIRRTSLSYGCRLGLPDHLLSIWYFRQLWRCDLLLLAKFPPRWFLYLMALAHRIAVRIPRTIYITSSNPRAIWPNGMPDIVGRTISEIVVQDEEFRAELEEMGFKGKVHVLPLLPPMPADPPSMRPGRAGTTFRLGYLGRLSREKNLGYLLDIVGAMRTPVETHIFGCGPEEAALKQQAAAKGLNVIFHGAVLHEDVPVKIDQCDLFLITSLFEGQCLVALEVLSRGRPLLATPVGALSGLLRDRNLGRLLPRNDVISAAQMVDDTLSVMTNDCEFNEEMIVSLYKHRFDRIELCRKYQCILKPE